MQRTVASLLVLIAAGAFVVGMALTASLRSGHVWRWRLKLIEAAQTKTNRWFRRQILNGRPLRAMRRAHFRSVHAGALPFIRMFDEIPNKVGLPPNFRRIVRRHEHDWAARLGVIYRWQSIGYIVAVVISWLIPPHGFYAGMALMVFLWLFWHGVAFRIWQMRRPETMIFNFLLMAWYEVSRPQWYVLWRRKELLTYLEYIAAGFEQGLPRTVPARDPRTDLWWRMRCKEIAGGMRDLKSWILTPGRSTRADLEDKLRKTITNYEIGLWDELPRCCVEQAPPNRPIVDRVRDVAMAVVFSGSAYGVYKLARYLPDGIIVPATVLLGAASLLRFISAFDPAATKGTDLRGIIDLMQGASKLRKPDAA